MPGGAPAVQPGGALGGAVAGVAVDLDSLTWPLPLPAGFVEKYPDMRKDPTQALTLRWAAATLQALQASEWRVQVLRRWHVSCGAAADGDRLSIANH